MNAPSPKPRKPRDLNAFELAGRASRSLKLLDEQLTKRRKALKEAEAERKKLIDGLSAEVRALLKLDEPAK